MQKLHDNKINSNTLNNPINLNKKLMIFYIKIKKKKNNYEENEYNNNMNNNE